MLLWTSRTAPEDLVSGEIVVLSSRSLPFTHGSISHIPNKLVDRPFPSLHLPFLCLFT
jgi:hypothetical protein